MPWLGEAPARSPVTAETSDRLEEEDEEEEEEEKKKLKRKERKRKEIGLILELFLGTKKFFFLLLDSIQIYFRNKFVRGNRKIS